MFTAFSGSHQDAIKKGLEAREVAADRVGADLDKFVWLVPYLPIDPKDIGRTYEAIIRVNSQSGKGGMAYLLKTNHNLDLPKRLQVEFDKIVQNFADTTKKEVKDEDIWRLFKDEYLPVEQSGMTAAGVVVGDRMTRRSLRGAASNCSRWPSVPARMVQTPCSRRVCSTAA